MSGEWVLPPGSGVPGDGGPAVVGPDQLGAGPGPALVAPGPAAVIPVPQPEDGPDRTVWMRPVGQDRPGPAQAWLPRPYHQLLRGPTLRWWRPLASLGIAAVGYLLTQLIIGLGVLLWAVAQGVAGAPQPTGSDVRAWSGTPIGVLVVNLSIASWILVAQFAVWGGFGWRPRWVSSVVGGVRWGWLGISYLIATGIAAVIVAVAVLLAGDPGLDLEPAWIWFAVVVVTTTPLQAAGEEYVFRGWLPQAIGSWFARPVVAALVGSTIAAVLFALIHGPQNPWLFGDRFVLGLIASYLVWRTGGLEASIAVHGVNNLLAFGLAVATGQVSETVNVTESNAAGFFSSLGMLVIVTVGVLIAARVLRVTRLFTPTPTDG